MIQVATWNLHGDPGSPAVCALLAELSVDVLCLQECPASAVEALLDALGPPWEGLYAPAAYLGNALLSQRPMAEPRTLWIGSDRTAAVAVLSTDAGPVPVCCTHLDHIDAEARLEQWADLSSETDGMAGGLLCGDLNALTRSDYTDAEWSDIADHRALTGWEPPETLLMDALAEAGFTDAGTDRDTSGTSRFGTRIDYILLGPGCPLQVCSCEVLDADGLSDHNIVLAVLA